jgi:hypothetical protein
MRFNNENVREIIRASGLVAGKTHPNGYMGVSGARTSLRPLSSGAAVTVHIHKELDDPRFTGHPAYRGVGGNKDLYANFLCETEEQLRDLLAIRIDQMRNEDDEDIEEGVEDVEKDALDTSGHVYAYSYAPLPGRIKIGSTTGDVRARLDQQMRGTSMPIRDDELVLHSTWKVADARKMEQAIHAMLKVRGRHMVGVGGVEWFETTVEEIQSIVDFVGQP